MSEDSNIIDLAGRTALERGKRQGFLLTELDGPALKSVFDAAFIDASVDDEGDCVVRNDINLVVESIPAKDLIRAYAIFPTTGTREQALEFCNRFNLRVVLVRAQLRETPDSQGRRVVIFDYDRLTFEDERILPKTVVQMTRRFEAVVRNGIAKLDEEKIF